MLFIFCDACVYVKISALNLSTFKWLPDFVSSVCVFIVEQKTDFMDSLLVWSPEPQRKPGGLARLQCAAFNWDLLHTRRLAEILSWNQHLCCHWFWLGCYGKGVVGGAIFGRGRAEGWGVCGLAAKGEEIRVCGYYSKATQGNTTDVTELNVSLSYLTTKQSSGELQKKDLTHTRRHRWTGRFSHTRIFKIRYKFEKKVVYSKYFKLTSAGCDNCHSCDQDVLHFH